MDLPLQPSVDLSEEIQIAKHCAEEWGFELGPSFQFSNVSYVAPTSNGAVLKVAWGGDTEAIHEPDALALWDGRGAVRMLRRSGRALLEERAMPGDDLSRLPDAVATRIAIDVALKLWQPATPPFRPVAPEVSRWLDRAESEHCELVPLARKLFAEMGEDADWVVHGDLHHHNILRSGDRYLAIDPKPHLSDREYDVPAFLWNPIDNRLEDFEQTERRIQAFVAAGLDEFRIRAWTTIRGSYLRSGPEYSKGLKALLA
jgi:streptomycin 6-kinase